MYSNTSARLVATSIGLSLHAFGFQTREYAFDRRIAPPVALPAHAVFDALGTERWRELAADALAALVRTPSASRASIRVMDGFSLAKDFRLRLYDRGPPRPETRPTVTGTPHDGLKPRLYRRCALSLRIIEWSI